MYYFLYSGIYIIRILWCFNLKMWLWYMGESFVSCLATSCARYGMRPSIFAARGCAASASHFPFLPQSVQLTTTLGQGDARWQITLGRHHPLPASMQRGILCPLRATKMAANKANEFRTINKPHKLVRPSPSSWSTVISPKDFHHNCISNMQIYDYLEN